MSEEESSSGLDVEGGLALGDQGQALPGALRAALDRSGPPQKGTLVMREKGPGQEPRLRSDPLVDLSAALNDHNENDLRLFGHLVDNPPRTHA